MQRNTWPRSPKWLHFPPEEKRSTLAHYQSWLSTATYSGNFFLVADSSIDDSWSTAFHHGTALLPHQTTTLPRGKHLLALTGNLPSAGQLALSANGLSIAGAAIVPEATSFLCTTFDHHAFHTLRISYNDLALPSSPSSQEMEILALGLLGYSAGLFPSLLSAVDEARKYRRLVARD